MRSRTEIKLNERKQRNRYHLVALAGSTEATLAALLGTCDCQLICCKSCVCTSTEVATLVAALLRGSTAVA